MRSTLRVSKEDLIAWYEAWGRRDWDRVGAFLGRGFVACDVALGVELRGRAEYLRYAKAWAHAFPDATLKLDRLLGVSPSGGDLAVVEYSGTGTQQGPWVGFPPSRRKVTMRFCDLMRFEHDKLVQLTTYSDLYAPLRELGHVPPKARFPWKEVA
ncbi:MAG: ester cyclase [Deltaproteobacteria bacterium]|nr:ester cyclase [Deltaproteobacteria bacterium]